MKVLFFTCVIVLVALSVLAVRTLPEQRSHIPIMYWCTDPNPARGAQKATYHKNCTRRRTSTVSVGGSGSGT